MMQESANALGIHLRALVEDADGATAQVVPDSRPGSPSVDADMDWLVRGADVLTFEHEHIPADQLERLTGLVPIRPAPEALIYAQDKIAMRRRLQECGIACPAWFTFSTREELAAGARGWSWPLIVKWARGGYDGHGVARVSCVEDAQEWIDNLAEGEELLAEEAVPFTREVAALVVRSPSGQCRSWPLTQTVQEGGICREGLAPAPDLDPALEDRALAMGRRVAEELDVTGVLAVEMFLVEGDDPQVLVNELAMRPHNSGHWTLDGSVTSQFENHLRAVLDLPLGDTSMVAEVACMVNVLGSQLDDPREAYPRVMAAHPGAKIRYYGKGVRPGRKLGHVCAIGSDAQAVAAEARRAAHMLEGANAREGEQQ